MNIITEKAIDKMLPNLLKKIIEKQIEKKDEKEPVDEREKNNSLLPNNSQIQINLPKILNQVKGLIKIKKYIALDEVAEILSCETKVIKRMVYEMVGEDLISGDFNSENVFTFENDIDAVISVFSEKISEFYTQN